MVTRYEHIIDIDGYVCTDVVLKPSYYLYIKKIIDLSNPLLGVLRIFIFSYWSPKIE